MTDIESYSLKHNIPAPPMKHPTSPIGKGCRFARPMSSILSMISFSVSTPSKIPLESCNLLWISSTSLSATHRSHEKGREGRKDGV